MPTLIERATRQNSGSLDPLDMDFFGFVLRCYASNTVGFSAFARSELGLTVEQTNELTTLLATMPATVTERAAWCSNVLAIFLGGRFYLEELDSPEKVQAALDNLGS